MSEYLFSFRLYKYLLQKYEGMSGVKSSYLALLRTVETKGSLSYLAPISDLSTAAKIMVANEFLEARVIRTGEQYFRVLNL